MKERILSTSVNQNEQQAVNSDQASSSRRRFLRRSVVGAAALVPASLLVTQSASAAAKSAHHFRAEDVFEEIKRDEDAHVSFLLSALGSAARPKPTFKNLRQPGVNHFVQLSQVFENVGVGAYLLAAPAISDKGYLAAAGSILTIEARHAGYLNTLVGLPLSTNGAFDKPISQAEIVKDVLPFIESLNGGSDPSQPLRNDTDILNFALLLEYLEATFYDINVPRFY
ncbi:MAG TPA: ferritin-like domain-containing protein [Ktedonobacteraceae bacterium]|nr:ferritin-like domain-containing protein [Ktedonobacteraceae bacterium]